MKDRLSWFRRLSGLPYLSVIALLMLCVVLTVSQTSAAHATPKTIDYNLKDLGIAKDLKLSGVDSVYSVPLNLPRHLEATAASLHLTYRHSGELLDDLSHINIRVDGQHVATVPILQENAGQSLEERIELPAHWLGPDSEISYQLIGHYTMACENPGYPGLWAEIDADSVLHLTTRPKAVADNMDALPEPFFDRRSRRLLELPFVLPASPDPTLLEAAGIVASWLGALADYRGARFPVLHSSLPASGNAVVFMTGSDTLPGLDTPVALQPGVSVAAHPSDPASRLLIINGGDSAQTRTAALALALGDKALSGQRADITNLTTPAPRHPYDAPRWVPVDKPVFFGRLPGAGLLQVQGFSPAPVRIGLRFPPDLYDPDGIGLPVNLRYHYTPRPKSAKGWLLTNLNGLPIDSIELDAAQNPLNLRSKASAALNTNGLAWHEAKLTLPVNSLPANSLLEFYFHYEYLTRGECKDVPADSVAGRIAPESTLDISHLSHFIALPDMAAFANAGFPFSKFADLSQTAVVLGNDAGHNEHTAYLTLLGHIAASTGYPATHVKVIRPDQIDTMIDKDILVIAPDKQATSLGEWSRFMPAITSPPKSEDSLWSSVKKNFGTMTTEPAQASAHPPVTARLTGFESPVSSQRSVVVLAASHPDQLDLITTALLDSQKISSIEGSDVGFDAQRVYTLDNSPRYHNGNLSVSRRIVSYFTPQPLLLAGLGLLSTFTLGILMYVSLRARAARRLKAQNST